MLESLLKILNGEKADKIIWTADIWYWKTAELLAGRGRESWRMEIGHLELCRELGVMPYYYYDKFWVGKPEYDAKIEIKEESAGNEHIYSWRTPIGELVRKTAFCPMSSSDAITKYPVENEKDLKILIYVLSHRHLEPDCLDDYASRCKLWASYDGLPSVAMPRSPLPQLFVEWIGVENGVFMLIDQPELMQEAMRLIQAEQEPIIDAVCECGVPLIHFADNLTSETFTGFFENYLLPLYQHRIKKFHSRDIKTAVHLDGTVRGLLPKLAAVGFDAIEALTPAPMGDIEVSEMRSIASSKSLILWGGVPGAMFSPPHDWAEMKNHVEYLIHSWSGTPFIIGVGDQVPPDGDITMCRKITDLIKEYRY